MTDKLRETLSALLDDEANELELRRILNHSDGDELRRCWADYNRQQQVLRDDTGAAFANWDISGRVSAALEQEAAPLSPWREWLRPVSGVAVAASVAAVVVLGARSLDTTQPLSAQSLQASVTASQFSPSAGPSERGSVTASAVDNRSVQTFSSSRQADAKARFEYYLRRHTERAALNNGQGMMSYARVVGHEVE